MTIGDLKVEGISYQRIINLDIIEKIHTHGICNLTVIPDKNLDTKKILSWQKTKITVRAQKKIIFCGIISQCYLEKNSAEIFLRITALTLSVLMDFSQKKFTFQSPKKKISDVLKKIEKNYKPAEINFWKDSTVENFLYCNNLTDWEFLKNFAESNGQILFADSKTDKLRVSMGFKPFKEFSFDKNVKLLRQSVPMNFYKKLEANTYSSARSCYFLDQTFFTYDVKIGAGYGVKFENQVQAVILSRIYLSNNFLCNEITLRHAEGCRASAEDVMKHFDEFFYLTGKVLESKDNFVKVQFDCDKKQSKDDAQKIPYESNLSNYLYTMPDEKEKIFVYVDNIRQAAMGTLRTKNISDAAEKKSFKIKKAELNFDKEKISFSSEKSSELTEGDSVKLSAKKNIIFSSKGDIIIQSAAGMLPDNQLVMAAPHFAGYAAYTATLGQPATVQFNPAASTVGKLPAQIKNSGAKKESVELSDLAKELNKITNTKEKKSENKNSNGSGGKIKIEAKKSSLIKVKDSSVEMKEKNLNVKTRALMQVGYIPTPGGGTGSLSKFEGGTPKNRSDKINVEHGSQDRKRSKEKISPVPDNKNISR